MSDLRAAAELLRLIDGFKISQAIFTAAALGVADVIVGGAGTSDAIADAAGADREAMCRLLRALAAHGVLREDDGRRFSLTPMGECLRTDAEFPLAPHARLMGQAHYQEAWGQLIHSVKTGENAFCAVHGMTNWAYRDAHPDQRRLFAAAMTANSRRVDAAIVTAVDFARYPRVADVGGGQGSLLRAILVACPDAHGVLFDQPQVIDEAAPLFAAAGLTERCSLVAGSFLDEVPALCDAYVLKYVLHDWDDENAVRILAACRRAMAADARVLVVERLVGTVPADPLAALSDLNMLVVTGGRERTRDEFEALFQAAGLRLDGVASTSAGLVVLTGVPA